MTGNGNFHHEQMNLLRISSIQLLKESEVLKDWIGIEMPDYCDGFAGMNR